MSTIYRRYVAAVLADAWTAATRPLGPEIDLTPWRAAQDAESRPDQVVAGLLACHAIRIHADRLRDTEDEVPLWVDPVADTGHALRDSTVDERVKAALAIQHAIVRGPTGDPGTEPARLVTAVLRGSGVAAHGQAARAVADRAELHQHLAAAWYATYGPRLLNALAAQQPTGAGRPRREAMARRRALRAAAVGVGEARIWPKLVLAREAGVSRPTLDVWLRAGWADLDAG